MWRRFPPFRQAKLNLVRFVRLRGSPEEVARGMALGIFIGMTPTLGLQMILAALLAFPFRLNKIAAILGVWISNPVTAPFIYALEYETGRLLLGLERVRLPARFDIDGLGELGWNVLVPMALGSLIYGVLAAGLAYALTLRLTPLVKEWRIPRWPRRPRNRP